MPSVIHSTEVRFGNYGSYISQTVTDNGIGPGTYHRDANKLEATIILINDFPSIL